MFFAFSCEFIYLFIFQPGGRLLEFIIKVDLQATISLSFKNLGMSLNISSYFLPAFTAVMKLLILLRVLYGESLFSCYVEKLLFVPQQFEYDVSRYGSDEFILIRVC